MITEQQLEQAIESLHCAEINCNNVPKLGLAGVSIVKLQIQDAIKLLGGKTMEETIETIHT